MPITLKNEFWIHKPVKYLLYTLNKIFRGKVMEHQLSAKSRKMLKNKMASVFCGNIKTLSPDLRGVLLDDLVTALESRLNVLNRINHNTQFATAMTESAEFETIKT